MGRPSSPDALQRRFALEARKLEKEREKKIIGLVNKERVEKRSALRAVPPTVSSMLDSAYQSLAMQFHLVHREAHAAVWKNTEASAFHRLCSSLVMLQSAEKAAVENIALGDLDEEALKRLSDEAKKVLSGGLKGH